MNITQHKNQLRHLINERKELVEKAKSLFHRAQKGSDLYFKAGKLYRNALNTLKEMEEANARY